RTPRRARSPGPGKETRVEPELNVHFSGHHSGAGTAADHQRYGDDVRGGSGASLQAAAAKVFGAHCRRDPVCDAHWTTGDCDHLDRCVHDSVVRDLRTAYDGGSCQLETRIARRTFGDRGWTR